jgi:hypothetical protein
LEREERNGMGCRRVAPDQYDGLTSTASGGDVTLSWANGGGWPSSM